MEEDSSRPQINASKLRVGGEIAGAVFTVGTMLIFLIGIPVLRYVFPVAAGLGCLMAIVLRFARHDRPGEPWILAATEKKSELPSGDVQDKARGSAPRIGLLPASNFV